MSTRARAYVALVVASFLWASMLPASKAVLHGIGPAQVSLVRGLSAWLVLTVAAIGINGMAEFKRGFRYMGDAFVLGIVSFVISSLLALIGLLYIPASVQGVITSTTPIWLAVGAMFGTRGTLRIVIGSVIALFGVGVVLLGNGEAGLASLHPIGVALALINSGVIALSNVLARRGGQRSDPLTMTALAGACSVPFLVVYTVAQGGFQPVLDATLPEKLGLLYVGVFCTAMNFGLWFWGLKYVVPEQAAPIQYIIPPLAVVLSWATLGEPLTLGLLFGMILILFGIALTQEVAWRKVESLVKS